MINKKLLLATTIGLVTASTPLFAAPVSNVIAGARASSADVQAENLSATQAPIEGSAQTKPLVVTVSRLPSLYAGFGIDLLNNRGFTGLMPKAMLGYGMFYGCNKDFYSALEIGGGAGSIPLSSNNTRYRISYFGNVSVLPGYMIYDDVLLYGRLGVQATHYSKLNSTQTGGVYGVGLELFNALNSQHWDARFEYNYSNKINLNQFILDIIYRFRC